MKQLRLGSAVVALCLIASGCGFSTSEAGSKDVTVTVFAAASLTGTFTDLGVVFEAKHPGVRVAFNFAGSPTLAEQIDQGAAADVFASADQASMTTVTRTGLSAGDSIVFASNRLTIAVPPDNPAKIAGFADLATPGLALVVCAPSVPCGAARVQVEQATGVRLSPVSEEQAVSDVMAKVLAGEADAGLVFQTDAIAAGEAVLAVDFPESSVAITQNAIVALTGGSQAELGQQFVDLVLSEEGRSVLAAAGFGPAP
ncbi:MAG: molybdate ABC transporter substrate-binding protein [Micropruina sp.]